MWKSHRFGLFGVLFLFLPSFLYNLGGITPSQPLGCLIIQGMAYISLAQGSPSTSKLALSDLHKPQCYNHTAGRYVCVYIHTCVYVYVCIYTHMCICKYSKCIDNCLLIWFVSPRDSRLQECRECVSLTLASSDPGTEPGTKEDTENSFS